MCVSIDDSAGDTAEAGHRSFLLPKWWKGMDSGGPSLKAPRMANFQPAIIKAISQPATAKPWYEFRPLLISPQRVADGVAFWNNHAATLERARREFGIPEEIVAAVIGVETNYGVQRGRHRVLDALPTLAFDYPKRAGFFRAELEPMSVFESGAEYGCARREGIVCGGYRHTPIHAQQLPAVRDRF